MEAHLAQILNATLSPEAATRQGAEQELNGLLENQDVGLALARIGLASEASVALRQIAGVLLKRFVDRWWDVLGEGKGLSDQNKLPLLQALFQGLSLPESKLRSQFAHSLAVPLMTASTSSQVLPEVLRLLATGSQDEVHGAMRVFSEVVRQGDLDLAEVAGGGANGGDERILEVVRNLSPVLLNVLGNEGNSAYTRASAIAVFRQCIQTLFMLKEQLPILINEAIAELLPTWLEACITILAQRDVGLELKESGRAGWEKLALRREIIKTLSSVLRSFPRALTSKTLSAFLPLAISHLSSLLPFHLQYFVSTTSDASPPPAPADQTESDVTIEQVVSPLIDLLSELTRAGKLRSGWISEVVPPQAKGIKSKSKASPEAKETEAMEGAISAVLGFTQMTTEDEENWASDPNAFVADEDDETDLYSLRIAGHDFISTLIELYPQPASRALQSAIHWRVSASDIERANGNPDWWKGTEAGLACVGGVAEVLLEQLELEETAGGAKSFDLGHLLMEVIPKYLAAQDLPFLQGRSFVVASQFSTALSQQLAAQYLDAAVQVLEAEGLSVSVKISGVKTIKNFCRHLPAETVKPLSHRILSKLVPLILQAGDEVLALVLESLRSVLGVDETALDIALMGQLVNVLLDVWTRNAQDPIISSIFEELFHFLASLSDSSLYASLASQAFPRLCESIKALTAEDPVSATLAAGALELLSSIFQGRKGDIDPQQIGYVPGIARVVFPCVLHCDDMLVSQNGVELLTILVRKDSRSLCTYIDPDTQQNGLSSIFAVISLLLRPTESESRGLFLGELIVHLLRNAGDLVSPVLPDLVKAIIERIPTSTYATFQQSLIIPVAYLIHTNLPATLSILESTAIATPTSPSPVSALEVLLRSWCENSDTFQGPWAIRVSVLALGALFTASAERESLRGIRVRGDMIVDEGTRDVIMTRSKTKSRPIQYTSIPFPLKALKILIAESKSVKALDAYNTAWDADDADEDDEDDDGEWADDGPSFKPSTGLKNNGGEFGFLSDMMSPGGLDDEDDDGLDREDEDLQNDPVSTVDLHASLSNTLRSSYAQMDGFGALASNLSEEERSALGGMLV